MSKFKIFNLFDKIFITTSVFLIIYAWINFFIRDLWITFFLSLIFSFACVFILFYFANKKQERKTKSKTYLMEMEEKFLMFRLLSNNDKLNLLKSIIEKSCSCETRNNSLVFTKENKINQIFIALEKEKLTQFDLINLISKREKNVSVLTIICPETETGLNTKVLNNLQIEIVTKKKLYDEFFSPNNIFPDCSNLNNKNERKKFKEIAKNFFLPHKAKSYFLCGLILIFSSIILPYHTYYLIFGTVLLIFSVICKLMPIFIL